MLKNRLLRDMPGPAREADASAKLQKQFNKVTDIVVRRIWWAIPMFVCTMVAVVYGTRHMTPIFSATSTVVINHQPPKILAGMQEVAQLGTSGYYAERKYYDAQRQILGSRELAQLVVDRNGLAADEHLLGLDRPGLEFTPEQRREVVANADVASIVAGKVSVVLGEDTMVARVTVRDSDAQFAATLANWLVEAYRDRNLEHRRRITRDAFRELRSLLAEMEKRKNDSEKSLIDFETANDLSALRRRAVEERLLAFEQRVRETSEAQFEARQRLQELRKMKRSRDLLSTQAPVLSTDQLLAELKRRFVDLSLSRKELEGLYLAKHPKVLAIDEQITHLLDAAQRHLDATIRSVTLNHEAATAAAQQANASLQEVRAEDTTLRVARSHYDKLLSQRDEDKRLYDLVATRLAETDLTAQVEFNNIDVLDAAIVPGAPIRPNKALNYSAGLAVALLLGVLAALAAETFDATVKTRGDIEALPNASFLGALPTFGLYEGDQRLTQIPEGRQDLYVHYLPNSRGAEAARTLRTSILFSRPDAPPQTLLVTSALPREGKTTTSTTIAVALAGASGSCVLIDTDLRKPRLHKVFGIENDKGVTSYVLSRNSPVTDFLKETQVPGLWLLPCGPVPPNGSEILHSERFKAMMAELKETFEICIYDSSPVAVVSDAMVLSHYVDGVILVAQSGHTRKDWLTTALERLHSISAPVLGVVLSRAHIERQGYGYYYKRGYNREAYSYRYAADTDDEAPT